MGESMSKERELLKEVMSHFAAGEVAVSNGNFGVLAATLYNIQELLAQPEQEQATPRQGLAVAKILEMALYWMKVLKFVYARPDYDYENPYLIKDINELEELLTQPEEGEDEYISEESGDNISDTLE